MVQTVSMVLAEFASGLRFDELPSEVVDMSKRCLLDFIGVAVAGRKCPLLPMLEDILGETPSGRKASVIGQKSQVSLLSAPLINGTIGHFLELDDGHKPSISHPGTVVIPAALAVSEIVNATGKDLLLSIVLGYETMCRIGASIQPSHQAGRGFHTTGTCGAFGAAVAAARLLGLSAEQTAHAIGLAGLQASGLLEVMSDGEMSKPFQAGKAAHNGVLAALMAERGAKSPLTILEGEKGFIAAMADDWRRDVVTGELGERYAITDTYFKLFGACGLVFSAVEALMLIMREHALEPQDVAEIVLRVQTYAAEVVGKRRVPETLEQARFSLPYAAAAAVVRRSSDVTYAPEKPEHLAILDMIPKVTVVADPVLDATFPDTRSAVARLTTCSGESYEKRVDAARGHPENPPTCEELRRKYMSLAGPHYGEGHALRIAETVAAIDTVRSVLPLVSLLRGEGIS